MIVIAFDAIHLRLLQHDLRNPNAIGVACLAPRKVASLACKPAQEGIRKGLQVMRAFVGTRFHGARVITRLGVECR